MKATITIESLFIILIKQKTWYNVSVKFDTCTKISSVNNTKRNTTLNTCSPLWIHYQTQRIDTRVKVVYLMEFFILANATLYIDKKMYTSWKTRT